MARNKKMKKDVVEQLKKEKKKTTTKKEVVNGDIKQEQEQANKDVAEETITEQTDVNVNTETEISETKTTIADDEIPDPVNVLDEAVNEKDYAAAKISGLEDYKGKKLPEQQIIPQNIEDIINAGNEQADNDAEIQAPTTTEKQPQESTGQIDMQEQQAPKQTTKNILANDFENSTNSTASSERLAKFVVKIYKYLWVGVGKLANVTPETVANRIAKGKLNPAILSVEFEIEPNVTKTVLEFITDMSEKIDEITTLSKNDEQEFIRLLTAYFIKKGWGLSEELDMIFAFGEHFIVTSIELIATRTTINSMLRNINEQLGQPQQQVKQQSPPPQQQAAPTPPPPKNDNVDMVVDATTEQAENIEVSEIVEPEETE